MLNSNEIDIQDCRICYRIICRGCGWEPSEQEVLLIQRKELTECPDCGWSPSQHVL